MDGVFFVRVLQVNELLLHIWPTLELDIVDLLPSIKPSEPEFHIVAGTNVPELFWWLDIFRICLTGSVEDHFVVPGYQFVKILVFIEHIAILSDDSANVIDFAVKTVELLDFEFDEVVVENFHGFFGETVDDFLEFHESKAVFHEYFEVFAVAFEADDKFVSFVFLDYLTELTFEEFDFFILFLDSPQKFSLLPPENSIILGEHVDIFPLGLLLTFQVRNSFIALIQFNVVFSLKFF